MLLSPTRLEALTYKMAAARRPSDVHPTAGDSLKRHVRKGCSHDARLERISQTAIKNNATKDEITEALGLATTVNAGAALVYSTRAMDAFEEYPRASSWK